MEYVSTRGAIGFTFSDAIVSGFAPDGGLFVPAKIPQVSQDTLRTWSTLSFPDLCTELASLFIPEHEISREVVKRIAHEAAAKFQVEEGQDLVDVNWETTGGAAGWRNWWRNWCPSTLCKD